MPLIDPMQCMSYVSTIVISNGFADIALINNNETLHLQTMVAVIPHYGTYFTSGSRVGVNAFAGEFRCSIDTITAVQTWCVSAIVGC